LGLPNCFVEKLALSFTVVLTTAHASRAFLRAIEANANAMSFILLLCEPIFRQSAKSDRTIYKVCLINYPNILATLDYFGKFTYNHWVFK
jgi:hypothetical protein